MTGRTRSWLQGFLHLNAEAESEKIPAIEIARQEDTVLRALDVLDREPGVLIADEVGMGKTFEALGVIACVRHQKPSARILVITPGPDLNAQWMSGVARFREHQFYAFGNDDCVAVDHVTQLLDAFERHPIVFAPVSIFQQGRAEEEQAFIVGAWLRWRGLHEETRKQIASHVFSSRRAVPEVTNLKFLQRFTYDDIRNLGERVIERAFQRGKGEEEREDLPQQYPGLNDLYESGGAEAFRNRRILLRAIARAQYRLLNALLPRLDLLVVDEAHKLKNPWSLRTQAVSNVLFRKYDHTVFLTATPFQLGVHELEQVFRTFSFARSAPSGFLDQVQRLFAHIREYQEAYRAFEEDWRHTSAETAIRFALLCEESPELEVTADDPLLQRLAGQAMTLRRLKGERLEPEFQRWMIRSLKGDKIEYRRSDPRSISPAGEGKLPFLVYERLLTEVFRVGQTTFKAAAEINMTSSFEAALTGALLSPEREGHAGIDFYRDMLRATLKSRRGRKQAHPKLAYVCEETVTAAVQGDKTLIFCERVETIRALRRSINERWREELLGLWRLMYRNASQEDIWGDGESARGRHGQLQARFRRGGDALHLALRENYVHALADLPQDLLGKTKAIVANANTILAHTKLIGASAERFDYRLAKKCIEQAVWKMSMDAHPELLKASPATPLIENILSKDFLAIERDAQEVDEEETVGIGQKPRWLVSARSLSHFIPASRRGIWYELRDVLAKLATEDRVQLVEGVASFLVRAECGFLPGLLGAVKERGADIQSSEAIRDTLETWWREPNNLWRRRLEEFVESFVNLDSHRRRIVLDEALKTGDFVRDTLVADVRERLREAFNTPFYPMVLVANRVMQEGLDLHRNCRRVVHHDLSWNPAQLEQRVGRVDRIGALVHRLRAAGEKVHIDILFPIVDGTIDVRQYGVVREREKWLAIFLGVPPKFSDEPAELAVPVLPEKFVNHLTIQLRPPRAR